MVTSTIFLEADMKIKNVEFRNIIQKSEQFLQ